MVAAVRVVGKAEVWVVMVAAMARVVETVVEELSLIHI